MKWSHCCHFSFTVSWIICSFLTVFTIHHLPHILYITASLVCLHFSDTLFYFLSLNNPLIHSAQIESHWVFFNYKTIILPVRSRKFEVLFDTHSPTNKNKVIQDIGWKTFHVFQNDHQRWGVTFTRIWLFTESHPLPWWLSRRWTPYSFRHYICCIFSWWGWFLLWCFSNHLTITTWFW